MKNNKMNECVTVLKLNVHGVIHGGEITGHSFDNDKCKKCGIFVNGIGAYLEKKKKPAVHTNVTYENYRNTDLLDFYVPFLIGAFVAFVALSLAFIIAS